LDDEKGLMGIGLLDDEKGKVVTLELKGRSWVLLILVSAEVGNVDEDRELVDDEKGKVGTLELKGRRLVY
jgi:hypothetical protein